MKRSPVVTVEVPVFRDGEVVYDISFSPPIEMFQSIVEKQRPNQDWTITKAFTIGDQATGTHVLMDLYNQTRDKPKEMDLEKLWKELGVERTADGVRFDNTAPMASIRQAITAPPKQ